MVKFLTKLILCAIVSLAIACAQSQPASGMLPVSSFTADNVLHYTSSTELAISPIESRRPTTPGKSMLWKVSVASLLIANSADIASSWGKRELNPALAAPSTKFGAQSAGLKAAIVGVVFGVEYLAVRRHPSPALYRTLSILNFCESGVVGGVAAHNFTVPAYSH